MDQIKENKTITDSILKIDLLNEKNEKTNLYNEIKKNKDKNGMVIFIYPKANTPGCTKQAQLFKENFEKIVKSKFFVYGLSADSPKAQAKWKQKLNLQYDLLCDEEKKLLREIGCLKGNSIIRSHLIIRNDFNLSYFKKGVSPTNSADDILGFLLKREENGNINKNENTEEKKKSLPKINGNEKDKNKKSAKVKKNKNGINKVTTVGKKNVIKKNKNSERELNNNEENKKELKRKGKGKGENIEIKKKVKTKEAKKKSNTKKEGEEKKSIKKEKKKNLKIKVENKKQLNNKDDNKKKIKIKEEQKKKLNHKGGNKKEFKNKGEKEKRIEKKKQEIKKNTKIKDKNQSINEIKNEKKVKKVLKKKGTKNIKKQIPNN
ncbi:merozoite capping protein 1, putative [Plasmodium relictum]|uniref:Peroxiredoxin, putative n=1 Tax=Plasmodium relictum TaxID=85471 RepID=A0A1J1H336_PLARL|nr:merozoite capping protein 1, putative [Plasmodium relictum]CRG99134.1 merozoite capping protein 1, putative [Plasmodium relictum]